MRLVLYQPEIPQNTGAMMRLCACLGVGLDLIEPCGFLLDDRRLRRVGLDYRDMAACRRHASWDAFVAALAAERADRCAGEEGGGGRLVLLSTHGDLPYCRFAFRSRDRVMVGRESGGVPDAVHALADARLVVPLHPPARSLNVVTAAAMVLGEALRQTGGFAEPGPGRG